MRQTISIDSHSAAETLALARRLGAKMPTGAVIAATGDLGAGKTVFASGLAQGLGVSETVLSPTYIYFNDYQGRVKFCHLDAYRLEGLEEEEIALIGVEDCFSRDKAVFCEWPQFVAPWLPSDSIHLELRRLDATDSRRLTFCYDDLEQEWLDALLRN